MIKMTRSISTKKATRGRSLSGEKDLLILLGLALLRIRSVLLLYSFIKLGGYENHSVVLDSLGILPFLWLEVASTVRSAPLTRRSNEEVFSFLRQASTLMKAEVREFSSPFFSLRLMASEKRATLAVVTDGCLHPYLRNLLLRKNFPSFS